ncbi:hypothetical protein PR202_gb29828 [Eleusine coracana subsp. coracana]|uniref:Uncharacterized protein n=1 Tax=Eleusine coracana subsp. coracana TaxID=191504 RepID=A0AAV5G1C1_ELECO|nr:hypothetical protein PR202_gb29828 [Eleusine coracana subsp. coracana]
MGNCAASRLAGGGGGGADGGDPVALCRDRKRLIKAAAERRFALAAAHASYAAALRSVADALDVFVARHTAPAPILITLPTPTSSPPGSPSPAPAQPQPLPSPATPPPPAAAAQEAPATCESAEDMDGGVQTPEMACPYYYAPHATPPPPPPAASAVGGWDFFNPFYGAEEVTAAISDEEMRAVREREGIPDLEEAEEEEAAAKEPEAKAPKEEASLGVAKQEEPKDLCETAGNNGGLEVAVAQPGRELLAALKEVEELFSRAAEAGKEVSSMLEAATRVPELKGPTFYSTIDQIRQTYQKKCVQLRNQDAKGSELRCAEKTRTTVRDLYTRIWVSLRAAESISDRIQKLRDEELQPQLVELLQGLTKSWKIMVDSHETQRQIMFEVNSFTCPAYGKFCNDAQRHATLKLEVELRNWRSCFMCYVNAQKAYIEALDGWLSKFILTDTIRYSRGISSIAPDRAGAPTLVVMCHDWYTTLSKFPNKRVAFTMRNFVRSVRVLWLKQGEEQQQKRKVDSLAKEMDKKLTSYKRAENKVIETKLPEFRPELDVKQRMDHLSEKKELLNTLRKRVEAEKAKHHACMRDTHDVTLNGFKIGLASIFESLTEFSKDAVKLYEELLTQAGAKDSEEKATEKRPGVEGPYSQIAVEAT